MPLSNETELTQRSLLIDAAVGYKLQRTGLPLDGRAELYQDQLVIYDENNAQVYAQNLSNLKHFKRSFSTLHFEDTITHVSLSFKPLQPKGYGSAIAGAHGTELKAQRHQNIAKDWQIKLQSLHIPVKDSIYNGFYDLFSRKIN